MKKQLNACKNVFVTDGAYITFTGTQNPSLTYMAPTAYEVDYAVSELKKAIFDSDKIKRLTYAAF